MTFLLIFVFDFPFSTSDPGNFIHSWFKKETPFIQTSVYYQMFIEKKYEFHIFLFVHSIRLPLQATSGAQFQVKEQMKNLTCIYLAYLHIPCDSILTLKIK